MIGIFRSRQPYDNSAHQVLTWADNVFVDPNLEGHWNIYDTVSQTTKVGVFAPSYTIGIPLFWNGCLMLNEDSFGIMYMETSITERKTRFTTVQSSGQWGDPNATYTPTTVDIETSGLFNPLQVIHLASGGVVAAFFKRTSVINITYMFLYRNPAGAWQLPVQVAIPKVASESYIQSTALIQHPDSSIYFFRHQQADTEIGMIKLTESQSDGTLHIAAVDPHFVPDTTTGGNLPPFVGDPNLQVAMDAAPDTTGNRGGIVLAYQTSVGATTFNRARVALCFVSSTGTKSFTSMPDKYVANNSEFVIGSDATSRAIWFAGETVDASGNPTTIQVGTFDNGAWTFTNTIFSGPPYPIRDNFNLSLATSVCSGFGYLSGNVLTFQSFVRDYGTFNSGNSDWVSSMIGSSTARTNSTAVDSQGNIFVSGNSIAPVNFGTDINGNNVTINNPGPQPYHLNWLAKYRADGVLMWVKSFRNILAASTGSMFSPSSSTVSIDNSDNVIFCGSFCVIADFEGNYATSGPFVKTALDPYGNNASDMFVVKYSNAGAVQWVRIFGGDSPDYGVGASICPDGSSIIFAGKLVSRTVNQAVAPINFGTPQNPINLTPLSSGDLVLCKLNGSGVTQWAVNYGGDPNLNPPFIPNVNCLSLAVDSSGAVVVTGSYSNGKINLGGGIITGQGTSGSIFVAKYSGTNGAYQWGYSIGGSTYDKGTRIVTHPISNNIIFCGNLSSTANFDGGNVANGSTRTGNGPWLACYSPTGTFRWVLFFGTAVDEYALGLAVNSSGYLSIAGTKGSDWDYHTFAPSRYALGAKLDHGVGFYLVSFTVTGDDPPYFLWLKTPVRNISPGGGIGNYIAITDQQRLILAGNCAGGNMDVGGHFAYSNNNTVSGFLAKIVA